MKILHKTAYVFMFLIVSFVSVSVSAPSFAMIQNALIPQSDYSTGMAMSFDVSVNGENRNYVYSDTPDDLYSQAVLDGVVYWNQKIEITVECQVISTDPDKPAYSTDNMTYKWSTDMQPSYYSKISDEQTASDLNFNVQLLEAAGDANTYIFTLSCETWQNDVQYTDKRTLSFTTAGIDLQLSVTADKTEIYQGDDATVTATFSGDFDTNKCPADTSSTIHLGYITYSDPNCSFLDVRVNYMNEAALPLGASASTALEVTHVQTRKSLLMSHPFFSGTGSNTGSSYPIYVATYKVKGMILSPNDDTQKLRFTLQSNLDPWTYEQEYVTIKVVEKPFCGDGQTNADQDEECDDGAQVDGDGCSSTCLIETCGDGVVDTDKGEECDDGNRVDGDRCSSACLSEACTVDYLTLYPSSDWDGDGDANINDNCPCSYNPTQYDPDFDGVGETYQANNENGCDNCPLLSNPRDLDHNGDGSFNSLDSDFAQSDADNDGHGDSCDVVVNECGVIDSDGDAVFDLCDNCVSVANTMQNDSDGDGIGNSCPPPVVQPVMIEPTPQLTGSYGAFGGACSLNTLASPLLNNLWFFFALLGTVGWVRMRIFLSK